MYNIVKLLKEFKIVVPMIQRDYAYGREEEKAKREGLLDSIFDVLTGKSSGLRLNYIYGVSNENGDIILIDGQQRTTTLYLIRLYLTINSGQTLDDIKELSYATRTTSKEFCAYLYEHKNVIKYNFDPHELITDKLDNDKLFFKKWRYDPTVASIICVLDAIDKRVHSIMSETHSIDFEAWLTNLEHVEFEFVLLEGFKREEDLYTAMNGRGKQLTQFEKLKPIICECLKTTTHNIDDKINNEWVPAFWNYAKAQADASIGDSSSYAVENHDRFLFNYFRYVTTMLWLENNKLEKAQKIDFKAVIDWIKENARENEKRFICYIMDNFNVWFADNQSHDFYQFTRDIQIADKDDNSGKTNLFWDNVNLDFVRDCCENDQFENINLIERIILWAFIVYKWNESNSCTNGRSLRDYYVLMRDVYAASWDTHTPTSITKNPTEHLVARGIMEFRKIVDGKYCNDYKNQSEIFNSSNSEKYVILNNKLTSGCSDNVFRIVKQDSYTSREAHQFAENINVLVCTNGINSYQAIVNLTEMDYLACYGIRSDRLYLPYTRDMLRSLFSMTKWSSESWYEGFLRKMSSGPIQIINNSYPSTDWKYYLKKYKSEFVNSNVLSAFDYSTDESGQVKWFEIKSVYGLKATSRQIASPFLLAAYRKKHQIDTESKIKDQVVECLKVIETRQIELSSSDDNIVFKDNSGSYTIHLSNGVDLIDELALHF